MHKPTYCIVLAALVIVPMVTATAQAQNFPTRPIRMIVPFAAGGSVDAVAKAVNAPASKRLGQPVYIEYVPGASGGTGAGLVAGTPADGYTVLLTSTALLIANAMYKNSFDAHKDFTPVVELARFDYALIAHPKFAARTVRELVELGKKSKGTTSFASSGSATASRVIGEVLNKNTGADLLHVPYRGAGPARMDVVERQVDVAFDDLGPALAAARAGKVRVLATTGKDRSPLAPDVPTIAETFPGVFVDNWIGVFVRSGTPKAAVDRLNAAFAEAVKDPAVAKTMAAQSLVAVGSTPAAFEEVTQDFRKRYVDLIKQFVIEPD
ncbi:MAG: Bug family tripartite tricarboxylate transporter substrate binding protein [Burkholderiales bacterium]